MTITQPTPTHYTVENRGDSHRFIILSRKVWYVIATIGVGVTIWAAGSVVLAIILVALLSNILGPADVAREGQWLTVVIAVAMLGVTIFWAFMGTSIVRIFLWHIAGKETIEVTSQSMTLRRQVFNWGRAKIYPVERIKDLRLSLPVDTPDMPDIVDAYGVSLTFDWLVFDYEAETIRFARGIGKAEARQLLGTIEKYLFGD
ncbi:hypothetical protein ACFLXQ_01620 [Chloroflexota bacterium]